MDFETMKWYTGHGHELNFNDVIKALQKNIDIREIHIGTDSHNVGNDYIFATAVCMYLKGKGGVYFFTRFRVNGCKLPGLGMRLQREVEVSLSVANLVRTIIGFNDITVHADTSPDPVHKSFKYTSQLQNFIKAMGYDCLIKPDAWVSGSVADRHAK